jgi:Tol biopolymer transport system component
LSTSGSNGGIALGANGLEAYFQSDRESDGMWRLYHALRESPDEFGSVRLERLYDSANQELAVSDPSISHDGSTLYFTSLQQADLYVSTRLSTADPFVTGMPLSGVNSDALDADPFITGDGMTLYFDTSRNGDFDIYSSVRSSERFGAPQPVSSINTRDDEYSPVLSDDGKTLYFSTDHAGGGTHQDIWVAQRASISDGFGPATPVAGLDTPDDEYPEALSADGCTLYFDSGRTGVKPVKIFSARKPR